MKRTKRASSIVIMLGIFLLCGCESLSLPNIFAHDDVPDEVKDQPRLLSAPTASTEEKDWPRLGDVPKKPKDFSSKEAYDQAMDELEANRSEAEATKTEAQKEAPPPIFAAPQHEPFAATQPIPPLPPAYEDPALRPPQFIQ